MKWFKKGGALILVLVMLALTACGTKNNDTEQADSGTSQPDTNDNQDSSNDDTNTEQQEVVTLGDKPLTFTMLYEDNANYPYKQDWFVLTEIKERLNVDLKLEAVPGSDYAARRTVVFNSGEMPDIISKTFNSDISSYISSGLFLPISDYVDRMPNYKAFIDKYDYHPDLDNAREIDGKYYMLPINCNTQRINSHGWLIRMDQLDEYGIKMPTTMEEVYEACKIWKEHNPDAYPMTNRFGSPNILSKISQAFNTNAGWNIGNMFRYQEDNDNFEFVPTSDEYKEMLMWFNKMYQEELLDVEFTTLDSTVYEERAKNGEQFIMIDWIGNENRYNRDGPTQSGNENFNIQPMMPPKGPWGHYSGGEVAKYEQGWVINAAVAKREDFPEFLAFIDWFYSDEAAELLTFGIEGETFKVLEDGRKEYMDLDFDYTAEYGINQNCLTPRRDNDQFASNKTKFVVDLFAEMNEKGVFKPNQPSIILSDMEKEEEGFYRSTLNDYINQMNERFIFGVESFDNWDAFVAECEAKGRNELHELYNKAWEKQNQ